MILQMRCCLLAFRDRFIVQFVCLMRLGAKGREEFYFSWLRGQISGWMKDVVELDSRLIDTRNLRLVRVLFFHIAVFVVEIRFFWKDSIGSVMYLRLPYSPYSHCKST